MMIMVVLVGCIGAYYQRGAVASAAVISYMAGGLGETGGGGYEDTLLEPNTTTDHTPPTQNKAQISSG